MLELEEIECPFCEYSESYPIWKENGYIGNKCQKCGLVYISPRPTIQAMAKLYEIEQAAGKSVQEHFIYRYSEHLHNNKILDIIQKYKSSGKLLEIGPGGGHFLLQARKRGYKPYAIEINREQAEKIQKKYGIIVQSGPVDDSSLFKDHKFDIIFHKDVLSHLHDPIRVFQHLNTKLNPKGMMIFETGNGGDLSEKILYRLKKLSYPEHLFLMSRMNIKQILELSGFDLLQVKHYVLIIPLLRSELKNAKNTKKLAGKEKKTSQEEEDDYKILEFSLKQKIVGRVSHFLNYQISQILPKTWPSSNLYIVQKK